MWQGSSVSDEFNIDGTTETSHAHLLNVVGRVMVLGPLATP